MTSIEGLMEHRANILKPMPTLLLGALLFACSVLIPAALGEPCKPRTLFADSFDSPQLDQTKWRRTWANDFRERTIDLVLRREEPGKADRQLRLRANTLGTDDTTVKYLGVVSRAKIDLQTAKEIEFELDWNKQANGSYLTAGIYLAPRLTSTTPEQARDWLKFEYVGVPPGRNARSVLAKQVAKQLRLLDTEGWPDQQRTGRYIERQRLRIRLTTKSIRVFENGQLKYSSDQLDLPFTSAYIYFQMSSHSNYPPREIFFDNVVVRESCPWPVGKRKRQVGSLTHLPQSYFELLLPQREVHPVRGPVV